MSAALSPAAALIAAIYSERDRCYRPSLAWRDLDAAARCIALIPVHSPGAHADTAYALLAPWPALQAAFLELPEDALPMERRP